MFFRKARPLFGVDPSDGPPPQTPLPVPSPRQKGYQPAPFEFCIHLHTHQDLKCCRVLGQKVRYGRPCTRTTRHPQLACTALHCFQFFSIPPVIILIPLSIYAGTNLVWSGLLFQWLDSPRGLHPSTCASLTCGHVYRHPLSPT